LGFVEITVPLGILRLDLKRIVLFSQVSARRTWNLADIPPSA